MTQHADEADSPQTPNLNEDKMDNAKIPALMTHLKTQPDGVLEPLAQLYNLSLVQVVSCLPQHHWTRLRAHCFDEVMESLPELGTLTTIVHTADGVFEFVGQFPTGSHAHGFFNLNGESGMTGHLRPERCGAQIIYLERPFMGLPTAGLLFFNPEGGCAFKVFIRRDSPTALNPKQHEQLLAIVKRHSS